MTELSPAAQAIEDAYFNADGFGYQKALASVLREVVEQIVLPKYQYAEWELAHAISQEIRAIANELDETND